MEEIRRGLAHNSPLVTSAIPLVLTPLMAVLALIATAWAAGRSLTRRLATEGVAERVAVSTTLGLAILAQAGLLLGMLGLLRRGPVVALLIGINILGWRCWAEAAREVRSAWQRLVGRAALAVVVIGPIAALAFYPPTGFDALMYHLPFVRAFVRTGGLPFLADLRFPVFPQLNEVLFAEAVLVGGGELAPHLVELLMTLVTAAFLISWGRMAFSREAGWVAVAAWAGNPIVILLAGVAYVEAGLALFVTAALYASWRARGEGGRGWWTLAAVFAGTAAGVKYLGLFFVAVVCLAAGRDATPGRRLRAIVVTAAVAFVVMVPTYGRIVALTGNPVFPFFSRVFGGSSWDPAWAYGQSLGERFVALARLPWDVVFARERVGYQPPFSPVYLAAVPLLLWGAVRDPRVRRLLLPAGVYLLAYVALPSDARYLTAVLPVVSLAVGGTLVDLLQRMARSWRPLAAGLAVALFLPGWLYAGYRIARLGPVPVTAPERDRYLAAKLPVYPALRYLNRRFGNGYTVYAFHAENMKHLADGTFLGEWVGPASFLRMAPLVRDPEALHRELRSLGADHLLIVKNRGVELPGTPETRRRFRRVWEDRVVEIFEVKASPPAPRRGR
jgi:hypothetical protein